MYDAARTAVRSWWTFVQYTVCMCDDTNCEFLTSGRDESWKTKSDRVWHRLYYLQYKRGLFLVFVENSSPKLFTVEQLPNS